MGAAVTCTVAAPDAGHSAGAVMSKGAEADPAGMIHRATDTVRSVVLLEVKVDLQRRRGQGHNSAELHGAGIVLHALPFPGRGRQEHLDGRIIVQIGHDRRTAGAVWHTGSHGDRPVAFDDVIVVHDQIEAWPWWRRRAGLPSAARSIRSDRWRQLHGDVGGGRLLDVTVPASVGVSRFSCMLVGRVTVSVGAWVSWTLIVPLPETYPVAVPATTVRWTPSQFVLLTIVMENGAEV